MGRILGGARGEGYLGRTASRLTCPVRAHGAGRRAPVGGLLPWLEPGARGAGRRRGPPGLSSPRRGPAVPAGGRRPEEAGSLFPLTFSPCAFGGGPSQSVFSCCLLSNPHSPRWRHSVGVGGGLRPLRRPRLPPPPGSPFVPGRTGAPPGPGCARAGPADGGLPGATPYGPGLNLDLAPEPETRETGREAGKTRRPANYQAFCACVCVCVCVCVC